MVNPGQRMHILQALLALRHGQGAAILPPEITRIHMDFALKWNDGHLGPRKFWKTCLPRLKFWNPAIPMLVNRSTNQAGPATMSIYFRQSAAAAEAAAAATSTATSSSSSSARQQQQQQQQPLPLAQQPHSSTSGECPAPPPGEGERVVTIDMKNLHSDRILEEFMLRTGAAAVLPTPGELAEMRQVEELAERAAVDRAIMKKYIDDKRRHERMLAQARQEAEAIKLANQ